MPRRTRTAIIGRTMTVTRRDCANAIRALAMDAVQKANSGHPGMPMGMADIAEVLWRDYLRFNPTNPAWPNRDRFILSNGHGAMLHYALLHLTGFDLSLDELKAFRQLHSKTPGHPEFRETPGVETTTGPLGQGLANAVGMALAERTLAAQFNRDHFPIVDHYTYVFVGDGCLMEGISHEACSLAGTLQLGKLIAIYDDNHISIDGHVENWFTDNTPERFRAYHWHVIENIDGHDSAAIECALAEARSITDKPSLICCKTQIGYGSPNFANTANAHGAPLGDAEIALVRKELKWAHSPFEIPKTICDAWNCKERGRVFESEWDRLFSEYEKQYPELAVEFLRRVHGKLPENWAQKTDEFIQALQKDNTDNSTRKHSQQCLNKLAPSLPELFGGSADLTESNSTLFKTATLLTKTHHNGNYLHYGVREFGMSAIMNGMSLHGGFIPYGGTFLTFADYARNAIRLSALMRIRVIFVYSHDSVGLGEDGPTHQPIEHVAMLRMTPGLTVWRPCDLVETAIAWESAILHEGPSCLLLTRQSLPHQVSENIDANHISKGGYVLLDCQGEPEAIIIATGSEVHLATHVARQFQQQNRRVRVVSMPSCEIFKSQPQSYRDTILPPNVTQRIAIEAAVSDYWYQFVGREGLVIGIDRFGASAPAKQIFDYLGFSVESIFNKISGYLK